MKGLVAFAIILLVLLATFMDAMGKKTMTTTVAAAKQGHRSKSSSLALTESLSSYKPPSSRAQLRADRRAVHLFHGKLRTILHSHRRNLLEHYHQHAEILYKRLHLHQGERAQNRLILKWGEVMGKLMKTQLADAVADMLEAVEERWGTIAEGAVRQRRNPFNPLEELNETEQKPNRLDMWRGRLGQNTAGKDKTNPFAHLI